MNNINDVNRITREITVREQVAMRFLLEFRNNPEEIAQMMNESQDEFTVTVTLREVSTPIEGVYDEYPLLDEINFKARRA